MRMKEPLPNDLHSPVTVVVGSVVKTVVVTSSRKILISNLPLIYLVFSIKKTGNVQKTLYSLTGHSRGRLSRSHGRRLLF